MSLNILKYETEIQELFGSFSVLKYEIPFNPMLVICVSAIYN